MLNLSNLRAVICIALALFSSVAFAQTDEKKDIELSVHLEFQICDKPGAPDAPPNCTFERSDKSSNILITLLKQQNPEGKISWVGHWDQFQDQLGTKFYGNMGIALEEIENAPPRVSLGAAVGKAGALNDPNGPIANSASMTALASSLENLNSITLSSPVFTIDNKILVVKLYISPK